MLERRPSVASVTATSADRGTALAYGSGETITKGAPMGRILLGVVIGVILVIWLLASCVGAIF